MQFREGNPETRLRASELLARYPHIDETELAELVMFYNTAPAIDTALLTCDPALLPKIALFEAEQKVSLRHEASLGLLLCVVAVSIALIVYATWAGI